MSLLLTGSEWGDLSASVDSWLAALERDHPAVTDVQRGTGDGTMLGEPRWYVRMAGEAREVTTVWLTLGQRTVRYETYVLPAPVHRRAEVFERLLKRNQQLAGVRYSIGPEEAIYLRGELPDVALTAEELDRILGTVYAVVESDIAGLAQLAFRPA